MSSQSLPSDDVPLQTGKTNTTRDSDVAALNEAVPVIFFRPETGEFIFIPESELTPFENECRELEAAVDDVQKANQALDATIAKLHKLAAEPLRPDSLTVSARDELTAAYKAAKEAHQKLHGTLKPLGKLDTGRTSVVELLPVLTTKDANGKSTQWLKGKKLTHVRSDKLKSHWRTYPLRADQTKHAGKSVLKTDPQGRQQIDKEALSKGIKELKFKCKTEWMKVEEHCVQGVLFDWAESWNRKLSWDFAKNNPDAALAQNVDLSASAQLMRYLAGVGLSTEWDPKKGNCAIKASARAEFAVAEAKAAAAIFFPDKIGWVMSFDGEDGKRYPLGAIRFKAELALTGTAGASVVAEGSLAADFKDEKRAEIGIKGASGSPSGNSRELLLNGKPVDPGASVELEAFAGAKADVKLVGSIQWLNPEKLSKDYQDFAKVGPAVSGLAGIGAGLSMELTYVAGKFRFKCMASVCLGVGAKGKLELEVDAVLFGEFAVWFFYQLYHANFTRLSFVTQEAFTILLQIQTLIIDGATEGLERIEDFVGRSKEEISNEFDDLVERLEQADKRVQLMKRVLAQPSLLLHATPEAKGIVLYQLTRHDWRFDGTDLRNHASGYYAKRKLAVKTVLRYAHTRRDFDNIVQHMTPRGEKGNLAANKKQIMQFLDQSLFGDATDDQEMQNYYENLQSALKTEPSTLYAVVPNDSPIYASQANQQEHPLLAAISSMESDRVA